MASEPLVVRPGLVIPGTEIELDFARSGGPGGQNVNKVESKVVLRWTPRTSTALSAEQRARVEAALASRITRDGALVVHADRFRDRPRNVEDARERLAALLTQALTPRRPRRPTAPTRSSQRRRVESKRRRSDRKRERRGED